VGVFIFIDYKDGTEYKIWKTKKSMNDKIKKFIQDWINKNPSVKKKFTIENVFILPNNLIEIETSETTKKNLDFLKKHVKNFLLYFSIQPTDIIYSNNFDKPDGYKILETYLKSTGLKKDDFTIQEEKHSEKFSEYIITLNIDVLKLIYTKNLYLSLGNIFTYDKIDKKYKNTFGLTFQFTPKLQKSIVELNGRLQNYGKTKDRNNIFSISSPTIGFFKIAPSVVTVFINGSPSNDYSLRKFILQDFFDYYGINQLRDWTNGPAKYHTYKRGAWVKKEEIAFGYVEENDMIFNYPIVQNPSPSFSNDSDQPT